MSRAGSEAIVAISAFLAALVLGFVCRRRRPISPDSHAGFIRSSIISIAPVASGLMVGCLGLLLFSGTLFRGDRFHSVLQSRMFCIILAILPLLLLVVDILAPRRPVAYPEERDASGRRRLRWLLFLIVEFVCAVIVVAAGVRFPILGIAGSQAMELGIWAAPLTVLWIVVGINAAKLLDGIHGAASVLVLVAAATVWISTRGTSEYFLHAFSLVLVAVMAGSLPHNVYPAPLRLSGGGTACLGFLFATLTVLARQKSVAALAVIFPLLLSVLLIGAAMLGLLERNLVLKKEDE